MGESQTQRYVRFIYGNGPDSLKKAYYAYDRQPDKRFTSEGMITFIGEYADLTLEEAVLIDTVVSACIGSQEELLKQLESIAPIKMK